MRVRTLKMNPPTFPTLNQINAEIQWEEKGLRNAPTCE